MATPTQKIYADAEVALPTSYVAPGNLDMEFASVRAKVNGAGASGAFIMVLELLSQDGRIMAQSRIDQAFAVGDTGALTWAPFLRRESKFTVASCSYSRSGSLIIANNTITPVTFTFVVWDTANMCDLTASPSPINIPYDGIYSVTSQASWGINAAGGRIQRLRSESAFTGTRIARTSIPGGGSAANFAYERIQSMMYLHAGDQIFCDFYQDSGGGLEAVSQDITFGAVWVNPLA